MPQLVLMTSVELPLMVATPPPVHCSSLRYFSGLVFVFVVAEPRVVLVIGPANAHRITPASQRTTASPHNQIINAESR